MCRVTKKYRKVSNYLMWYGTGGNCLLVKYGKKYILCFKNKLESTAG